MGTERILSSRVSEFPRKQDQHIHRDRLQWLDVMSVCLNYLGLDDAYPIQYVLHSRLSHVQSLVERAPLPRYTSSLVTFTSPYVITQPLEDAISLEIPLLVITNTHQKDREK